MAAPAFKVEEKLAPTTGQIIYVPEDLIKHPNFGDRIGGWATIQRVVKVSDQLHYLTVMEFGGYFEYKWEDNLDTVQEELRQKYGWSRAYLKF